MQEGEGGHWMTRYEVSRTLGMRSLQLSEGAASCVEVRNAQLRENTLYVAALELKQGVLDAVIMRGDTAVHLRDMRMPPCVDILLTTLGGAGEDAA